MPLESSGSSNSDLQIGEVYTRAKLRELFDIRDATINNGVFQPGGRNEIWLFVTEKKQANRVQYQDQLVGGELHWQGQALGRTDNLIIGHKAQGNDILVFYRKAKDEHPGSGFRLEGRFDYVNHVGRLPASFVLRRRH
jgi:putative restriction endonuclease